MKRNKKLLVAAAAGALTVAAAVPAFALENEFHGSFTAYYDLSNFSAAGNDGGNTLQGIQKSAPTENYFVQRARLGYTAKVSDQVKLNTKFELDYTFWGNSSYSTGRNQGGAIGADSVQMETKNVFLELNYPALSAKIGMMPYNDSFKGILFDADMAGLLFSKDYANASVAAGFFRFGDNGATLGKNAYDMISLDAKYNVNKEFKVGGAYYYIGDHRTNPDQVTVAANATPIGYTSNGTKIFDPADVTITAVPNNDAKIHNLGLNFEGVVGPVTLTGFALKQFGDLSKTVDAKGYALNLGGKMALLGGTLRSEFLYVSGGKDAFYNPGGAGGTEGGGFYDAEMIMLNRDKNAKTIDTAIVYDANNVNQGVIMGSVGYDHACTDKITSSINAGFAAVANNVNKRGTSDYLGTEVNVESNYKLNANTTIGVRAGYLFLGDYFKGLDADNPYDVKVLANFAF
ncbi:membrane protein [Geomonas limicola]|uniref:Membrane protein n=1 Tax=Geomonas limicola TaxID=2740186 RepID=A0A6V8N9T8_9BACT|nr:porin [Geomonas limicola]GFO69328.1 membrane protein [Geomonas limicola]